MRPVGILGGMGPQATVLLMQKVIDAVPARDDGDHVPLIVHQNPAVPSRIKALVDGTGPSPLPALRAMANDLARAGATALAMPCNTAHHYAAQLRESCDLPLLDMLSATAEAIEGKGKIGILASPATRHARVFEHYFNGPFRRPENESEVLEMIRAIKAGAPPQAIMRALTIEARKLMEHCDHILIACTELSLAAPLLPRKLPWTDSLDCLVTRILDHAQPSAQITDFRPEALDSRL